ncbi:PAS domain S-box protein [Beggiatoa leptomitoformis]|uniref:histidine kinase n=1 Tax=Beggiatoa leptomitoformis TaxID=288004 RepID=A0A2N9YBZ4_9GAMM|nr:PAS domain S-box protein [Beggiatoa leptomitoformis]AUI68007.1 PAS domain S-box protein [Beggiatoa leptomitoformis]QGX03472.1 PAS domain S-box protein [Beggiatoa leptomitoformis]
MSNSSCLEISLLNSITDGVFLLEANGIILFTNLIGAQWFNKIPEEMIGRCIWHFLPTNVAKYRQTVMRTVIQTQQPKTLIDKTAAYWYEGRYFPVMNSTQTRVDYIAVYYRDITNFKTKAIEHETYCPIAENPHFASVADWQTKQHFGHILQYNPAVIYTFNAVGNPLNTFITYFVSQNVINLTGHAAIIFLSEPNFWFNNIHPEDKSIILEKLQTVKENCSFEYEYRFLHANGVYIWIQDVMYLIYNKADNTVQLSGSWLNITKRKLTEQAFNESEARFKGIFDNTAVGIAVLDNHTGRFLMVNDKLASLLGYTIEELSFFTLFNLCHPEDQQASQNKLQALSQKQIPQFYSEKRYVKQNGVIFWGATWVSPLINKTGDIFAVVCIIFDLTDRKETELALKDSEEMFRQASASSQDAIIIVNGDNHIIYWNQSAEKIFAYKAEEVLGKGLHEKILPKRSWTDHQTKFPQFKQTGTDNFLGRISEVTAVRKNGEAFPVEISVVPLKLKGQWHAVGTVRDITRRKQAEIRLKTALNDLQHSINEAEQARLTAESANQAKSTFLANMSHELRTPLNGILGYAQILLRDANLNEQQTEQTNVILRSGQHLLNLINDILDLSKIESGKFELNPHELNLPNFLHDIISIFKLRAEQKGLAFTYRKIPPPSTLINEKNQGFPNIIVADEKRLRQILLNLLSNAVKYTERGNVSLNVIFHNETMRFEVEDTGMGISEDMLCKIFIPFQQINQHVLQHNVEGTGLGLSITQKLVELMGSTLYVQSIVGKGSIFWFELKLTVVQYTEKLQNNSQTTEKRRPASFKGKKYKFLVVDDIDINRYVLLHLLSNLDVEIEEAENGQIAVDKNNIFQADVIIMDLKMPVMDGLTATYLIRQQKTLKQPFIIALSASAFKEDEQQSLTVGCNAFLAKPVDAEKFFSILEKNSFIEWKNEDDSRYLTNSNTFIQFLAKLPKSKLCLFYKLAKAGNVNGIILLANTTKQENVEYTAFMEELIGLAKNFKLKQLKNIFKDILGE